jgi:hypothetical protein
MIWISSGETENTETSNESTKTWIKNQVLKKDQAELIPYGKAGLVNSQLKELLITSC